MRWTISFIIFTTLLLFKAQAFDYGPVLDSVEAVHKNREERLLHFAHQLADLPLSPPPVPPKKGYTEYLNGTIARLVLKKDLETVNQSILSPTFKPWKVGTDIAVAGPLCQRQGDYDFVLMGLIRMAYLDQEAGFTLLTAAAREKLHHVLLSQKGDKHYTHFRLNLCFPFKIKDTENHILMTETARYLTNQLLSIDNERNGFNEWLLHHLSEFLRNDFDELNSRPYQGYTLIALSVLYDYAQDARVKLTAKMILDYLSAKTAVQSIGLRRYMPFRRQLVHRDADDLLSADNTMFWYTFQTARHDYLTLNPQIEPNSYMFFMAATGKYQVPDSILDLFHRRTIPVFQKIKSRDVEIYFSSPSFLLSAGGRHRHVFGYFTKENNVWSVPITIIPAKHSSKLSELFAIHGNVKWHKRNNTCVARNFACGTNFQEPYNLSSELKTQQGDWTFYNMTAQGFYLAVRRMGKKVMWEVREADLSFNTFTHLVQRRNPQDFRSTGSNYYMTSDGHRIDFNWSEDSLVKNPILAYDGVSTVDNFEDWDYAEGDVIQSRGDGLVKLTNPITNQVLILDARSPMHPHQFYISP